MTHLKSALAASVVAASLALSTVAPAKADQAAVTRNILIGAAAVAGIVIESNVARKNAAANGVAGYTQDGQTVYQDGSVAYGNGTRYYPSDNGQQVACNGQSCTISGSGYNGNRNYNGNVAYGDGRYRRNAGFVRDGNGGWRNR
ncbi:MAG: hypothetical protein M3R53_10100 [Candidatus Eremiobacteraeota bacterium]|nr:hypothetical protein [Candidatus Eremiobacteraeota bacterium]